MTKIKLMNYDASEYKLMEKELNQLSSLGFNCNSIDYLTFFKKDNKKAHYITDIFIPVGNTRFSKQTEKEEWINDYADKGYRYLGKVKNVYVFRGNNKNKSLETIDYDILIPYFKANRTLLKSVILGLSIVLSFFLLPGVFSNTNINEYITNGSIIIHYIPIPFCLIFIFRALLNLLNTRKIKKLLENEQPPVLTPTSKYYKLRNIYLLVSIISIILLIAGIGLDSINRKKVPVNDQILTLKEFNVEGNIKDYPNIVVKSSFMIPYSYSYFEQSGNLDVEKEEYGNILNIYYYEIKDLNSTDAFVKNMIEYPDISVSKIELLNDYDNVYLSYSKATNQADAMIIVNNKTIVKVATSFDLSLSENYQPILDFYLK